MDGGAPACAWTWNPCTEHPTALRTRSSFFAWTVPRAVLSSMNFRCTRTLLHPAKTACLHTRTMFIVVLISHLPSALCTLFSHLTSASPLPSLSTTPRRRGSLPASVVALPALALPSPPAFFDSQPHHVHIMPTLYLSIPLSSCTPHPALDAQSYLRSSARHTATDEYLAAPHVCYDRFGRMSTTL